MRLLYNDYEPNQSVIEAIAKQWREELGVDTHLVAARFDDMVRSDFDVLLALRYPTFPSPWAVVEHLTQLTASLDSNSVAELRRLLQNWLRGRATQAMPLGRISEVLSAALPVIPLFELRGHWLQRDGMHVFDYPDDGYFCYPEDP